MKTHTRCRHQNRVAHALSSVLALAPMLAVAAAVLVSSAAFAQSQNTADNPPESASQSAPETPASTDGAAQPAVPRGRRITADDEIVYLSPFVVSTDRDRGYRATNATSATRLDTPIKNTPLNLEVITNLFMQDTGATSLREALRYSSGVVLTSQSDAMTDPDGDPQSAGANDPQGVTRKSGDSTFKIRGFITNQVLRDGFRRQYSADWINIERVEVLRGPSALLYGVGSFGGVVNYIPKRPRSQPEYYIGAMFGSHSFARGEIDLTGPVIPSTPGVLDYRITAAFQGRDDFTQYFHEYHNTIAPSLIWRPFKRTEIFFDNEFGYSRQTGVGFQNIRNNVGDAGQVASRGATWLTDIFDDQSNKIGQNVDNRTFRWSGPDTYLKGPFRNNIIDLTQGIGDNFFVKVGYANSEATFDSRQVANAGPKRGDFTGADAARAAALYGTVTDAPISRQAANTAPTTYNDAVIQYEWIDYNRVEKRNQIRADATYHLDLREWGDHTFLAGLQYMDITSDEDQFGPAYSYGGHNVTNHDRYSYKNPQDHTPFRYGVQGDGLSDNPRVHLYNWVKTSHDLGYFAVYQGKFFKNILTVIGGYRWDRSDAREVRNFIYESTRPAEVNSRVSPDAPRATSPQIGISVAVTREISLFGVYSTGVVPNYYDRDGNGDMMKPTKAKNYEAGVKFDLFNGRLSGTVSAYKIIREGQPKYIWWAPSPYQSRIKGYDSAKPNATVLWYATPDAFWEGIHNTPGRTAAQQAALAKKIWPAGWYGLIDEIAASNTKQSNWSQYGPIAGNFWGTAWQAEAPTSDASYTGNFYFPLANYSDPEVAKFLNAILAAPGWKGNYYYTAGQPYRYGDGSVGYGNIADGSGASVPMDDESRGWDINLIWSPADDLQILASFARMNRKITTRTYKFVDAPSYWPGAPWFTSDNSYGTLDNTKTAADVYTDVLHTSTYNQTIPDYNNPGDDSPANSAKLWVRYSFDKLVPALKGLTIGLGGEWTDRSLWLTGFSGGGGNVIYEDGTRTLVKAYTKQRYILNGMVEYNHRFPNGKSSVRIALNVDNILNDKDLYGLLYAPGLAWKLSASVNF